MEMWAILIGIDDKMESGLQAIWVTLFKAHMMREVRNHLWDWELLRYLKKIRSLNRNVKSQKMYN